MNRDGDESHLRPTQPGRVVDCSQAAESHKAFTFASHLSVELIGEVFNLLNAKNPTGFIGDQQSPNFRKPTSFAGDPLQGEQRLAQLGLRIRF